MKRPRPTYPEEMRAEAEWAKASKESRRKAALAAARKSSEGVVIDEADRPAISAG